MLRYGKNWTAGLSGNAAHEVPHRKRLHRKMLNRKMRYRKMPHRKYCTGDTAHPWSAWCYDTVRTEQLGYQEMPHMKFHTEKGRTGKCWTGKCDAEKCRTGDTAHPWSTLTEKTRACQNMSLNVFSRPLDKNCSKADSFQSILQESWIVFSRTCSIFVPFPSFMTILRLKLVFCSDIDKCRCQFQAKNLI